MFFGIWKKAILSFLRLLKLRQFIKKMSSLSLLKEFSLDMHIFVLLKNKVL